MSSEAKFEVVTIDLLKHLKSKKEDLEARHAAELAQIEREIEAVSITLRLLREKGDVSESKETSKPAVIPNNLLGLSTREACIQIARRNNGIVRVVDAKDALVSARILKPSKNTWGIIYTTLIRSKEFEKLAGGAGEFRLVEAADPQASFLQ